MAKNIVDISEAFNNYLVSINVENSRIILKQPSESDNSVFYVSVISSNNQAVFKDYVLLKVALSQDRVEQRKKDGSFEQVGDVFILHTKSEGIYLGFEKNGLRLPSMNSEEHLKLILKQLAEFQAKHLRTSQGNVEHHTTTHVKNVVSSSLYKSYPTETDPVEKVEKSLENFHKDSVIVVESIGSIVFLKKFDGCIFLNPQNGTKLRSPVYDALMFIFNFTDGSKFRQHHLKYLLKFYHENLLECLKNENISLNFDERTFEKHIRVMLETVKYEIASNLLSSTQDKDQCRPILDNIARSNSNPIMNYEECIEAISSKLKTTFFDLVDYEIVPIKEKNGFLGDYFYLKATVNHRNKTDNISIFVKLLKNNLDVMDLLSEKEQTFFYRTYVPLIEEYELGQILDFVPKLCFDRFGELIALDDLSVLGFKPFKPSSRLTYDIEKVVFRNCAKFHASSILLEERMSLKKGHPIRLNQLFGQVLKDLLYSRPDGTPSHMMDAVNRQGINQYIDSCKHIAKDISLEDFKKKVQDILDNVFKNVVNSTQYRNTICHSDMFPGNVMAVFDSSGKATKGAIVDFQVVRYGPPAIDILFQLYGSTNKQTRDKYKSSLLNEYYNKMKEVLEQNDVDINSIYTKEQFEQSVNFFEPTAIVCVLIHSQFIAPCAGAEINSLHDPAWQNDPNVNEHKVIKYKLENSGEFRECIGELVQDLYDAIYNLKPSKM